MRKIIKIISKILPWLKDTLVAVAIGTLYTLSSLGVMVYFINYIISLANDKPTVSPLEIAATSGGLCGLILLGAFYQKGSPIEHRLKLAAKLLLGATISFVIAFFLLELIVSVKSEILNPAEWTLVIVTNLVIAIGGLSLIVALINVISMLRKL